MKVALVSALSPSRLGLSEYGFRLIEVAKERPDVKFVVFADVLPKYAPELIDAPNIKIIRIWKYNSVLNIFKLIWAVLREKPDIVWFNLLLSTFGDKPIPAFIGLLTPTALAVAGSRCYSTLHHLIEFMDFSETRFSGMQGLIRFCSLVLQKILCYSSHVVVLLDKYADHLGKNYGGKDAYRAHHGFLKSNGPARDGSTSSNILVFGKFGSYKKLDFAIETYELVKLLVPGAKLTIAGASHPSYPGYYESFAKKYEQSSDITFCGYLEESKLHELFATADVVFLPYSSSTGVSGVAHWAASFGVPIVAPKLDDFSAMQREEGIAVVEFAADDSRMAADQIKRLFDDPALWLDLSKRNLKAAATHDFPSVLDSYLKFFGASVKGNPTKVREKRHDR